jgi:hypothetical protein
MRKVLLFIVVSFSAVLFQNCKSKQATYVAPAPVAVLTKLTYTKDIAPVLQVSCSPCHFPPEGKMNALNSLEAVRNQISGIIYSVKLPKDSHDFMPFKNKKPALTESQIADLEAWQKGGMPE